MYWTFESWIKNDGLLLCFHYANKHSFNISDPQNSQIVSKSMNSDKN